MSKEKVVDLRVDPVPGSPVSLRKFIESGLPITTFTMIVDGTPERAGVHPDDPDTCNVTILDREQQADYFLALKLPMPEYLKKYLKVLYEDPEGKTVEAMYGQAHMNKGLKQMIGLIQLIAGGCNMARKAGKGIRFFVELPETYMHPAQQRHIPDVMKMIMDDYGPKPEPQQAEATNG